MHELAYKDRYLNTEIRFLINTVIVEYDMKDAGLSLIKKYKLLDKKMIKDLQHLNDMVFPDEPKKGKHLANVKIGKMQIKNKVLKEGLKQGYIEARDQFLTKNNLDERTILSIKKDAIFVTKKVEHTQLDDFINFREKNIYKGYLLIGKIEIYYMDNKLDIKNLGEEGEEIHKEYFLKFIYKFFKKAESSTKGEVLRFIRIFLDKYKRLELESEYYIQFRPNGKYVYKDGTETTIDYRQDKTEYSIMHNYNIIIEIIQQVL